MHISTQLTKILLAILGAAVSGFVMIPGADAVAFDGEHRRPPVGLEPSRLPHTADAAEAWLAPQPRPPHLPHTADAIEAWLLAGAQR